MTIGYASDGSAAGTDRWYRELTAALGEGIVVWSPASGWGGDPQEIDILIVGAATAEMFADLAGLRFVHSAWAGIDSLMALDLPPDLPVARLVDPTLAGDMAEHVVAQVMALHRQLPAYARAQAERLWRPLDQPRAAGRRIGFLGFGEMARASARLLAGIGFPIRAWARHGGLIDGVEVGSGDAALRAMLGATDILVNLLPLTDPTRGLLDRSTLSALPQGAAVVNAGRGAHLVVSDLIGLLDQGHLSHAALDVFAVEPLAADDVLWSHRAISITPHVAATTDPASASRIIADNIARFRASEPLIGLVERSRGY
jgi:glyoxylate/hydroxypyruvate reductase A